MLLILALSSGRGLGEGKKKETNLTPSSQPSPAGEGA